MRRRLAGLCAALAAGACAPQPPEGAAVVDAFITAYNDKDVDAMAALMHRDVQQIGVSEDRVDVVARGKDDLVRQMRRYAASEQRTRSRIDGLVGDGAFIAVREVAEWSGIDGDTRRRSALAVYEVENGLVRRVWYYPASAD
ncbi:MAG: nuclear transport factor 2 family protein [Pseudomonadota bacterium]